MNLKYLAPTAILILSANALPLSAFAQEVSADNTAEDSKSPQSLTIDERIAKAEAEIELLKRQREVQAEVDEASAATRPTLSLDKKGFKTTSVDKKYEFSFTGGVQFDARNYAEDSQGVGRDEFLARRLRPTFQFKAGNASFRLTPDFAPSSVTFMDAWIDYKLNDAVNFRFGKSKTPVGFERNVAFPDLVFIERGHATNLAPSRDVGFQVFGNAVFGILDYQIGIFDGNIDLGSTHIDTDENKDIFARIYVTPFANSQWVPIQNLGIGIAGSSGDRDGSTGNTILSAYKTPGQLDFFKYNTGVFASGKITRLNPQLYWSYGPYQVLSEYITETQTVTLGTSQKELKHDALTLYASWIITGEDAGYKGGVKPDTDFDLSNGDWGAFEVAVRYGYTDIDEATFGTYASLATSASKAESYGLGLSWYLGENYKVLLNYDLTHFAGGAATGADRPDEKFLSSRIQFRY